VKRQLANPVYLDGGFHGDALPELAELVALAQLRLSPIYRISPHQPP